MIQKLLIKLICTGSLAPSSLYAMEEKINFYADNQLLPHAPHIEDKWRNHLNDPSNFLHLCTKLIDLKSSSSIFSFEFSSLTGSPKNNEPTFLIPYLNRLVQNIDLFAITCRGVFLSDSTCSFIFLIEDKDSENSDTMSIKLYLEEPWKTSPKEPIESVLQKLHICPSYEN